MQKRESMKKKKIERRAKRIRDNNRKTVGKGWNTQKTTRMGVSDRRRDGSLFGLFDIHIPSFDFSGIDKKELKKNVKRVGADRDEKR